MTQDSFSRWLAIAGGEHVGYDYERKEAFLRGARAWLKHLAPLLDLQPASYDLRVNRGGIAVSGEVTLHSDRLYVQVSQWFGGRDAVLYRACEGRKDYYGKRNHYLTWADLRHTDAALLALTISGCLRDLKGVRL